jgi:hypothetical protein
MEMLSPYTKEIVPPYSGLPEGAGGTVVVPAGGAVVVVCPGAVVVGAVVPSGPHETRSSNAAVMRLKVTKIAFFPNKIPSVFLCTEYGLIKR